MSASERGIICLVGSSGDRATTRDDGFEGTVAWLEGRAALRSKGETVPPYPNEAFVRSDVQQELARRGRNGVLSDNLVPQRDRGPTSRRLFSEVAHAVQGMLRRR